MESDRGKHSTSPSGLQMNSPQKSSETDEVLKTEPQSPEGRYTRAVVLVRAGAATAYLDFKLGDPLPQFSHSSDAVGFPEPHSHDFLLVLRHQENRDNLAEFGTEIFFRLYKLLRVETDIRRMWQGLSRYQHCSSQA